jgi:uncharacterized membrane protein YfcA
MASDRAPSPGVESKQAMRIGELGNREREVSKGMLEKVLINFDVGVSGAVLRVALGYVLVPALQVLGIGPGPWTVVVSLLAMLFAVKVVAAVGRRVVPASDVVRSHWEWRRNLARYHDSYQWRKLLWIGIGLMMGAAIGSPGTRVQWLIGVLCVVAGGGAEVYWRRQGLGIVPPSAV